MDTNPLAEHKWVRIMTDYCANPVWAKVGGNADLDDLPVDAALKARLRDWADTFEGMSSDEPFEECDAFIAEGFAIALDVKRALPDWTVVYHDPDRYEFKVENDFAITDEMLASGQKPDPAIPLPPTR